MVHGDVQGLSDTMSFLKSLAELGTVYESGNAEKRQMRERKAAAGLFNWEVSNVVTKISLLFLLFLIMFVFVFLGRYFCDKSSRKVGCHGRNCRLLGKSCSAGKFTIFPIQSYLFLKKLQLKILYLCCVVDANKRSMPCSGAKKPSY